ncbi:MAG: PAS domain-containing protein [Burkholderiales bacterium]|nr:PAS domain-containing protein [Anaerolineae bacterium]
MSKQPSPTNSQPNSRPDAADAHPEMPLAHYRQIVESAGDVIFTTDLSGLCIYINPAVQMMFGYAPTEILGTHFTHYIAPSWKKRVAAYYIRQQRDGVVRSVLEFPVQDAHGAEHWVEQTVMLLYEGEIVTGFAGFVRDISDRKHTEEILATERNLLRTVIDLLPDHIFVKDRQSRFIIGNRSVMDNVGVSSKEALVGMTNADFSPPEVAQQFHDDDQRVMQSGQALINREELDADANGNTRWFSTTKVPLQDSKGNIIGIVGLSRDVTSRKKNEEALQAAYDALEQRITERTTELSNTNAALAQQIVERRQAEEALLAERNLLRILIDTLPAFVYVKDRESRFLIGNTAVAKVMGAAGPEALIGRTDFDFYPNDIASLFYADDQYIVQTGSSIINKEEPARDEDGNTRWAWTTKVPLYDPYGAIVGLVGIGRDITEHKAAQDLILAQQQFLNQIIDTDPNLIFVRNRQGQFTLVNQAFAEFWDIPTEGIIGKTDEELGAALERAQQFMKDDQEILRTLKSKFFLEEAVSNPRTGVVNWFQTIKVPIMAPDGGEFQVLGVATNITERKLAEANAVALAVEKERVSLLSSFVRDASHDFRTPLSTINTSLFLLERAALPEKRKHHMEVIEQQTSHLARLVDAMLTMTRLDSAAAFTFRSINISDLMQSIIINQRLLIESKAITLNVQLETDLPSISADPLEIDRVLTEILQNAVQYTLTGGSIWLRTYQEQSCVVAEFQDSGIGIGSIDLARIFERFYRADKARSTDTGGVGLGLSIAKKIVEAHNGEIQVRSEVGVGSTFRVLLPMLKTQ